MQFATVSDNKTGSAARFGGSSGPVLVFHTEVGTVTSTKDAAKLEMIHALWDSIDHDNCEVSQETLALLKHRAERAEAYPDDEMTSEEFWESIDRRYA